MHFTGTGFVNERSKYIFYIKLLLIVAVYIKLFVIIRERRISLNYIIIVLQSNFVVTNADYFFSLPYQTYSRGLFLLRLPLLGLLVKNEIILTSTVSIIWIIILTKRAIKTANGREEPGNAKVTELDVRGPTGWK